jgi:catechol 2,3-dioxygenase
MSSSIQGHELIYTQERTRAHGRLHHFAYVVGSREEVLLAAEIMADARVRIEAGPSRHTAIQGFYLYTREPGGNRIEVTHGGYLVFAPDAEPYVWDADTWDAKPGWGAPLPAEFHLYGTPANQD